MIKNIKPISGRGEDIYYKANEESYDVKWGTSQLFIPKEVVDEILKGYFVNPRAWYPLGASVDPIYEHGLGEYLANMDIELTPRHGSALAAILVHEGLIISKGKRPIYLQRTK